MNIKVDKEDFDQIVTFVKKANNYDGATIVDDENIYFIKRGNEQVTAAEEMIDDNNVTHYQVDQTVYDAWKEKHGYTL